MSCVAYGVAALFLSSVTLSEAKLREGDCDVCIKFLTKFEKTLGEDDRRDPVKIEKKLLNACQVAGGKDNRFCYYIGGTKDAATRIINEVTIPMKSFIPPERICEKLKDKDAQICDLQYEVKIDVRNKDLKKLRVKELRKILNSWEEDCPGCIEKNDFVQRIEELKDKHTEL